MLGNGPNFGDGEDSHRRLQGGHDDGKAIPSPAEKLAARDSGVLAGPHGDGNLVPENFCKQFWWRTNMLYISNFCEP